MFSVFSRRLPVNSALGGTNMCMSWEVRMRQWTVSATIALMLLPLYASARAQSAARDSVVRDWSLVGRPIAWTRLDTVPREALRAGGIVLPDSSGGWRVILAFDNPCGFSLLGHVRFYADTLFLDVYGRPRFATCPAVYLPMAFEARLGPTNHAHVLAVVYWDGELSSPAFQPVDLARVRPPRE